VTLLPAPRLKGEQRQSLERAAAEHNGLSGGTTMVRRSRLLASTHATLLLTMVMLLAAGPAVSAASAGDADLADAAPRYRVVRLGALAGDEFSVPYGINERGEVVGFSGGQVLLPMPFVYTNATGIRPLRIPASATAGIAREINDDGFVTGHITHSPASDEAARWRPNRRLKLLGSLGTPVEDSSYGYGINESRAVEGWSYIEDPVFEGQEAFRYTDAQGMESVTPGARPAFGFDINDSGDICGQYEFDAFRTDGDEIIDISSGLSGVTTGEAINVAGQVAITQERPDSNDAWRWTPGLGLEDLGLAATDEPVFAHGINTAGDVVGRGRAVGSADVAGGYLFTDGLGALDLTSLLIQRDRRWYISEAWDINDGGQIVATATNLRTGARAGVRLDPVG
jgi:uncharacterized membrane protein